MAERKVRPGGKAKVGEASKGADAERRKKAARDKDIRERAIDEALDESFPASDPPAWSGGQAIPGGGRRE